LPTNKWLFPFAGVSHGVIHTKKPNPVVSQDMLRFILTLQAIGESLSTIIDLLRLKTVPPGYTPYTWVEGM